MRHSVVTEQQLREAYDEYLDGVGYDELARRLECAPGTILRGFQTLGLPLRGAPESKPQEYKYVLTDDDKYALYLKWLPQ